MPAEVFTSPQRLVFPAAQSVTLEPFDPGPPGPGQVRVRTQLSMMSTGTENIVFNRAFDPGTHWDQWVKYPFHPGYIAVGTVEAAGPDVADPAVGQRVAFRRPHASHTVLPAAECYPVPEGLPTERALWFALAKIAYHGALAARYRLGDEALVIGAGPVGQMSVRWARAAGAAFVGVLDQTADRLEAARRGGATFATTTPLAEAADTLRAANDGRLPRVVIDSTGNAAVFAAALGLAADGGTVVVLGDTGRPAQQALTSDVIRRGLHVVGAHDAHNTPEWNNATASRLFFRLAGSGQFPLGGLTSHVFAPEDCAAAYALANRDRTATMGILFDWAGGFVPEEGGA